MPIDAEVRDGVSTVRPVLRPGLRRHRVEGRQHLTDAHRDLVVSEAASIVLDAVDGVHDVDSVLEAAVRAAARSGLSPDDIEHAWGWLLHRGLLVDADAHLQRVAALPPEPPSTRPPDRHSHLVDLLTCGDGDRRWRARRACGVEVRGDGATTHDLRTLLARSGVPLLEPDADTPADLVILTDDHEPPAEVLEVLMRTDATHLIGGVRDGEGQVGPLVVPGWSACSRCYDLHRAGREPSWRWRRALLARPPTHPLGAATASPAVVATTIAVLATESLAYLEGRPPLSCGGVLRLRVDDPMPSRHPLTPHPWCGCVWPSEGLDESSTMEA